MPSLRKFKSLKLLAKSLKPNLRIHVLTNNGVENNVDHELSE